MEVYLSAIEQTAETWDLVQAIPNFEGVVAELLFQEIFSLAPATLSLFSCGRDWGTYDGTVSKELFEGAAFRVHTKALLGMLEYVFGTRTVDDDVVLSRLVSVSDTLQQLGARHVSYGVSDLAHYVVVQTALFRVLERTLGKTWTPDVRQGWATVFNFVSKAMKAGACTDAELDRVRITGGGVRRATTEALPPHLTCILLSSHMPETSSLSISRFQDSVREKQRSLRNQAPQMPTRTSEWCILQSSGCQDPPRLPKREAEEDDDDDNTVSTGCKVASE